MSTYGYSFYDSQIDSGADPNEPEEEVVDLEWSSKQVVLSGVPGFWLSLGQRIGKALQELDANNAIHDADVYIYRTDVVAAAMIEIRTNREEHEAHENWRRQSDRAQ